MPEIEFNYTAEKLNYMDSVLEAPEVFADAYTQGLQAGIDKFSLLIMVIAGLLIFFLLTKAAQNMSKGKDWYYLHEYTFEMIQAYAVSGAAIISLYLVLVNFGIGL